MMGKEEKKSSYNLIRTLNLSFQINPVELNQSISAYLSSLPTNASSSPSDQLSNALRLSGIYPSTLHQPSSSASAVAPDPVVTAPNPIMSEVSAKFCKQRHQSCSIFSIWETVFSWLSSLLRASPPSIPFQWHS